MSKVRVVIVYTDIDGLESISVNGRDMDDISAIQDKQIQDWFLAYDDRSGWKGLIEEIFEEVGDREAELSFEFSGPDESECIFDRCIKERGFGTGRLSDNEITENNLRDAEKAEHRGLYKEALRCYMNAAEYGKSAEAEYKVAQYYDAYVNRGADNGINIKVEEAITKALEYYERAASQGKIAAQYRLYQIYFNGEGIKRDLSDAIFWLEYAAESGNADAQYRLGAYYASGKGVKKNYGRSFEWHMKAAQQGYARAQINVGICYQSGRGVKKSIENAMFWFQKAVEQDVDAKLKLAYLLKYEGKWQEAVEWYRRAAENGNSGAQFELAECYYNGDGVEENKEEAVKWYHKAAEKGRSDAQFELAECYYNGDGVEENKEEAVKWYHKAAEKGRSDAQFELAECYYNGDGVEKNKEEAVKWYRKVAEKGRSDVQFKLAECYYNGDGVEKNYKEAIKLYQSSADQGEETADNMVGVCYYNGGYGIDKNESEAVKWFSKAAENNDSAAQFNLGLCYENGQGIEKDLNRAFQWYKQAADNIKPHKRACFKMAEAYYKQIDPNGTKRLGGLLVAAVVLPGTNLITVPASLICNKLEKRNKIKAFLKTDAGKDMLKYYNKAADLGHDKARKRLKELKAL